MSVKTTVWIKSSHSAPNDDNCVETAVLGAVVGVRDSKEIPRGHISVPKESWRVLVRDVGC